MKLVFNFKDQLFWIHNFLPEKLYKEMYKDFVRHRNTLDFKKTVVDWPTYKEEVDDLSESFAQGETTKSIVNPYLNKFHTLLKHNPYVNFLNYYLYSHIRKYKYGQHLTWHSDSGNGTREWATSFYFNKTWRESWGGELMFKSDQGSGFIPIVGNSLVIVKKGLRHKVNANLKKTHPRLSIQTWVDTVKKE